MQCGAVCCSVVQCVTVCYSVLQCVTGHIWTLVQLRHLTVRYCRHMDESCHILISHKWVMWHAWISYVTHVNESCHIIMEERYFIYHIRHNRKWFTLHMSRGHATYLNELCQKCKVTLFYLSRILHMSHINGRCRDLCTPTLTKRVFICARVFLCVIQIMHGCHELGPFICHKKGICHMTDETVMSRLTYEWIM